MPNWAYNSGKIAFKKNLSKKEITEIKNKIGTPEQSVDFNLIMPRPKLTTKCSSSDESTKLIKHWYYNFGKLATEEQIEDALNGKLHIDGRVIHIDAGTFSKGSTVEILIDLLSAKPDVDYVEEIYDWYSWQNNNWGTKWNASEPSLRFQDGNFMYINFNTAWGINEELIYELIKLIDSVVKIETASFNLREESKAYAYDIEAYDDDGELSFCFADVLTDIIKDIEIECPECKNKFNEEVDIEDEEYFIYCDECDAEFQITYDNGKIFY